MRKSAGMITGGLCLILGFLLTGCQSPDQDQYVFQDNLDPYQNTSATPAVTNRPAGTTAAINTADVTNTMAADQANASSSTAISTEDAPPSNNWSAAALRVGMLVVVTFSDMPGADWQPHEEKIKEDGTLTLPLIGSIVATNKTPGQLQREIHDRYVPDIFARITVVVTPAQQFFTVSGEVRNPSRQAWIGDITLLQAIASAGGFTDYANEKKVQIIRANGKSEKVNYREILGDPSKDVDIYPGDRIIVPKRWL